MISVGRKIMYMIFLVIYLSPMCESLYSKSEYHISTNFTDILSYELEYTPNFQTKTFTHRCVWTVNNSESVNNYKFYSKNLDINREKTHLTRVYWNNNNYKRQASINFLESETNSASPDIDTYSYEGRYPSGLYNLDFQDVNGSLENNLQGFYFDNYFDENGVSIPYLITQFGPIGARYAFPSLDEPKYRATFKIIINRPKLYNCVISNARWKTSTLGGNLIVDSFETTEKIAPSSLTFLVSTLQISRQIEGSIHRFVGRPEIIQSDQHEYVSTLIFHAYNEIENFLRVGCEQDYLYHVALPSNKMKFENLGTYRNINHYKEDVLIISSQTSAYKEERSTIAITKLIAQQWFLSYLMVDGWKSVWISEGLTMFLSYNITAKLYPGWKIQERLVCETRISMQEDSRCCCTAINENAQTQLEIEAKFNRITVYKGTALITMLENILPPNVFSEGLTNLITHKKWSTYTSIDLYEEFEAILQLRNTFNSVNSPRNLSAIMSPWESQMGYPVLTVTRNYGTNQVDYVFISQKRFHRDDTKSKAIWNIPINYSTKFIPNFNDTKPITWLRKSNRQIKILSLRKLDWLILNNQATYYYRVQYDDNNWKAIAMALKENFTDIHYLNRMQIIDDAFSLAEFGMLKYSIAFTIVRYIKDEREYAPLKALKDAYQSINKKLADSTAYTSFQNFIRVDVEHIYENIKYSLIMDDMPHPNPDMHRQVLTIQMLFSWLCELRSPKCDHSRTYKLNDKLSGNLWMDLEQHALCTTTSSTNNSEWNQLFHSYKNSLKRQGSPSKTFKELVCSADGVLQEKFLIYIMKSEKDNLEETLKLIMKQEHNGVNLILKYIPKLFSYLLNMSTNKDIQDILYDIGSRVTTKEQLRSLITFLEENPKYKYFIKPSLRIAKKNLQWRRKHLDKFNNYFQKPKSIGTKHYSNVLAYVLIISYYVIE